MIAVVAADTQMASRVEGRALVEQLFHAPADADIVWLCPSGDAMELSADAATWHHPLASFPDGAFDNIYVLPRVRLYEGAWLATMLARLSSALTPGGLLTLPLHEEPGLASVDWLGERLGAPVGRTSTTDRIRAVACSLKATRRPQRPFPRLVAFRPRPHPAPASIAGWYGERHAQLARLWPLSRQEQAAELCETAARQLSQPSWDALADTLGAVNAPDADPSSFYADMSYFITGVQQKVAALRHVLRVLQPGREGRVHVDHGGGPGVIAAELMLEGLTARARVQEPGSHCAVLAADLALSERTRLEGRFAMSLGFSQDATYSETADVVSFIGSLLYMPRDQVPDILGAAWDALSEGGLLIVHENIKHPSYIADFDKMFTADELTGLMSAIGPVRFFASTSARELLEDEVGNQTVFRVVVKR